MTSRFRLLTTGMRQCFEVLAMGSVTEVQDPPRIMTLRGCLSIMSKKAFIPTEALHCNQRDKERDQIQLAARGHLGGRVVAHHRPATPSVRPESLGKRNRLSGRSPTHRTGHRRGNHRPPPAQNVSDPPGAESINSNPLGLAEKKKHRTEKMTRYLCYWLSICFVLPAASFRSWS